MRRFSILDSRFKVHGFEEFVVRFQKGVFREYFLFRKKYVFIKWETFTYHLGNISHLGNKYQYFPIGKSDNYFPSGKYFPIGKSDNYFPNGKYFPIGKYFLFGKFFG